MDYWAETMQDDCYLIAADGWKAETYRVLEKIKSGKKKGQEKDVGWTCDLVPKPLVVVRYFADEQLALDELTSELEIFEASLTELDQENSGEEGALRDVSNKSDAQEEWRKALVSALKELMPQSFNEYQDASVRRNAESERLSEIQENRRLQALKNKKGTITKTAVNKQAKETDDAEEKRFLTTYLQALNAVKDASKKVTDEREAAEKEITKRLEENPDDEMLAELCVIAKYLRLKEQIAELKKRLKEADAALDTKAYAKYPKLTKSEIKTLVVDDKWLAALDAAVHGEMDRVSQHLTQRVKELAERYETPLPQMVRRMVELEDKVNHHLERMGFAWK